ncbi:MAG: ADP-ribosylglycohydrolase family protein [Leptolyngbyaceae cyanobacterium CSU_1_4]|nr:ADP-ribosylglycohydrolase family protein [Leptolyngbyaceae cyanobacterium CSU_1_4]
MHYSLLSRFRGALLGTAIGEILGANCQQPQSWREVEHWGLQRPAEPSTWGKRAVMQAQLLVEGSSLPFPDPEDERVLIALVPIALFYHEDLTLLKLHLQASLDCASAQDSASGLPIGEPTSCGSLEAIALTLQQQSAPRLDFRRTLLQAAKLPHPPVHCAIVGALAGAAHGITGIPASWRQRLNRAGYASFWGLVSEAELLQIADDLLAAWSGVYHPTQRLGNPVVAAPRIIRR